MSYELESERLNDYRYSVPPITDDNLEYAREYLEAIVNALYSKKPLDAWRLMVNLDELCFALGVSQGDGDIQVQRLTPSVIHEIIPIPEDWERYVKHG